MTAWMTLGELALGLAAWGLGLSALLLRRRKAAAQLCSLGSLACCAASLCTVVFDSGSEKILHDIKCRIKRAAFARGTPGGENLAKYNMKIRPRDRLRPWGRSFCGLF